MKEGIPMPSPTAPAHQAPAPSCIGFCQAPQWRKVARVQGLGPRALTPWEK